MSTIPNFLKYSVREHNGKLALFDDNGVEVNIHKSITPKDKVFFTTWCVLLFSKKRTKKEVFPQSISFLAGRYEMLWQDVKSAIEFKKNGLVGWKTPDGKLIMPPIFEQLEKCGKFIWAKYFNREIFIYKNGELSDKPKFDNAFYQNGKKGIKNPDGTILFPAVYDDIYQWSKDSDVFYTLIDNEFHYYNSKHEEILTTYKKFDGVDDELCPYYIFERQSHKVLVTMQITDNLNDSQSCVCFGQNVRLNRILMSQVSDIINSNSEVWDNGNVLLDEFYSYYTYIYSAYWASSKSKTPIEDCINQFGKMDCFKGSWNYIIKIWTNRHSNVSISELNKLVWYFQDKEDSVFGFCDPMSMVSIGYDDTLEDNEVKMFLVRFFTDRPPTDYDDIMNDALSGDIDNYRNKKQLLIDTLNELKIKENWSDNYYKSEYYALFSGNEISGRYMYFDNSITILYDYLIENEGFNVKYTLLWICLYLHIDAMYGSWYKVSMFEKGYQQIKWVLGHNCNILGVTKNKSCLDYIQDSISILKKSNSKGLKTKILIFQKIERLLIKHGALTAAEIRRRNFNPLG